MGANFRHSRASNSEVDSLIWPKFKFIWEFMAVLATCKFDEDPIKIKGTIDRTRSSMGFFASQGQVTPKWSGLAEIRNHPRIYGCPGYLQVWWRSIKIECIIDKTRSNMRFFSTQRQVTLTWIVWCGWKSNSSETLWLYCLHARLTKIGSKVMSLLSGQHCLHYKSTGKLFITQWQVTPKKIVRSGPK